MSEMTHCSIAFHAYTGGTIGPILDAVERVGLNSSGWAVTPAGYADEDGINTRVSQWEWDGELNYSDEALASIDWFDMVSDCPWILWARFSDYWGGAEWAPFTKAMDPFSRKWTTSETVDGGEAVTLDSLDKLLAQPDVGLDDVHRWLRMHRLPEVPDRADLTPLPTNRPLGLFMNGPHEPYPDHSAHTEPRSIGVELFGEAEIFDQDWHACIVAAQIALGHRVLDASFGFGSGYGGFGPDMMGGDFFFTIPDDMTDTEVRPVWLEPDRLS